MYLKCYNLQVTSKYLLISLGVFRLTLQLCKTWISQKYKFYILKRLSYMDEMFWCSHEVIIRSINIEIYVKSVMEKLLTFLCRWTWCVENLVKSSLQGENVWMEEETESLVNPCASEELLTETGATVHVQPRAKVALAVVGAPGVDTRVLAAAVVDLALVDICKQQGWRWRWRWWRWRWRWRRERDRGRQWETEGR